MLLVRLALALLLVAVAAPAAADPPYTMTDPLRWVRSGGPSLSVTTIVGTTTLPIRIGTTPRPWCIKWDSQVVITASAEISCAWAMTATITLGTQDAATASELTDANGPDGAASVDWLPSAGAADTIPQLATLQDAVGARSGVCTAPVVYGANLAPVYPPCRVDGDCTAAGSGGTCNTSPTEAQRLSSCAFMVCRASAANTQHQLKVQR